MSEAAAAAPAAPSTTATAPSPSPAEASKEVKGATKAPAKAEPPAWGDEDDAKFFELAKRSPYRAKIKGEERAIDSKESLRELLGHAQRGIGASKLAEEVHKEREELKKAREDAAREKALFEKARRGDFEARKALGLVSPEEIRKRDAEWEAIPPEVRELYADRNKAHEELAQLRAEKEQREAAETQRREQAEIAAAQRVAVNSSHEVLKALGISESNAERMVPHVAGAIADLGAEGLELGVDMPTELIIERVKQRIGALDEEHFSALDTKKAFSLVLPRLAKMSDEELDGVLPPEVQSRIARKVARAMAGKRATAQQGGSVTRISSREEPKPEPPKVLSPFRFGRPR